MKNFVLISPHFPKTYYHFAESLKNNGFRVLGVGDAPYHEIPEELKNALTEYYTCYDMVNLDNQKRAIQYFIDKYGAIDYLESNNEYWLSKDAELREFFDIKNGVRPNELQFWQHKSLMKQHYKEAGARVADFILVSDRDSLMKFIDKVGYPVFIKPDIGVGAADDYKIENENDVDYFFSHRTDWVRYICEQYISGTIVSFDGICDMESNIVFCASNVFPPSVADVVKEGKDLFYYTVDVVPDDLKEIGQKVIKAFGVKQRFFHLEFFRLDKAVKGVGKKNDLVALETNMRPAGGYTPDMLNYSQSLNSYQIWADVMAFNENKQDMNKEKYFCACASRRNSSRYAHSDQEVLETYRGKIRAYGYYPHGLSSAMGDRYFMANFPSIDELLEFKEFAEERFYDNREY